MDRRAFLKGTAAATAGTAAMGGAAASLAVTGDPAYAAPARPGRGRRVRTGAEMLADDGYQLVSGQRVGIITNPTGVLPDLVHEVDVMAASDEIDMIAVFGPEHGFRGTAQAGGSEGYYTDPTIGLPVYDTYGKRPQELADIFERPASTR